MTMTRAIVGVLTLLMIAAAPAWAAQGKREAKPRGKTETLACRLGTEDRHARIAVVVIGGRTDSFAYYSKWKPRTCSVYLQRNRDMYSKWADSGNITTVNLEKGAFLIEHRPGEYHFIFRDIDRERYCGMDGVINGSLTIKRGSDQCILDGDIMVEGIPLGEANTRVATETPPPAAGASDIPEAIAKPAASTPAPVAKQQDPAPAQAAAKPAAPAQQPAAAAKVEAPAAAPQKAAAEPEKPAAQQAATSADNGSAPAKAAVAEKPAAPQKAAEASDNPFRAFFRGIAPGTPPPESP